MKNSNSYPIPESRDKAESKLLSESLRCFLFSTMFDVLGFLLNENESLSSTGFPCAIRSKDSTSKETIPESALDNEAASYTSVGRTVFVDDNWHPIHLKSN